MEGHADRAGRIAAAFRHGLGRPPHAAEAEVLERVLASYLDEFSADIDAAEEFLSTGESPFDSQADPHRLAAYAAVASLILNLDEAVTKQ